MKLNKKLLQQAKENCYHKYGINDDEEMVKIEYLKLICDRNARRAMTALNFSLTCALLLLLSFPAWSKPLLRESDKQKHFIVSAAIASSVHLYTNNWKKAAGACLAAGVGKEIYDKIDYGRFDKRDIAADVLGCAAGLAFSNLGIHRDYIGVKFSF